MTDKYIHGTHVDEQERLEKLNTLTNNAFKSFIEIPKTGSVLEIGSGIGLLAKELSVENPNVEFKGIEFSNDQLVKARALETGRLKFIQGDAHHLPFDSDQFDVCYGRYILEHVHSPSVVLIEMHRVLKTGGTIFLQENNIFANVFFPTCPAFDKVWNQFAKLQEYLGGDALIGKKLFSYLQEAGFSKIELSVANEVHWYGSPMYETWIRNLIGNIKGAEELMSQHGYSSIDEINRSVKELEELIQNKSGSCYFYWNRARAIKV
ncbi:MAG TPA: methyltransferase domain-containing protein [Bacteroidia bacterium]|nr:methyltransferase domain-containing protein [Bacteroidia bacterium]HNT80027.1 methyltransferase domain-containing protein [Bacteroidia bacterium]